MTFPVFRSPGIAAIAVLNGPSQLPSVYRNGGRRMRSRSISMAVGGMKGDLWCSRRDELRQERSFDHFTKAIFEKSHLVCISMGLSSAFSAVLMVQTRAFCHLHGVLLLHDGDLDGSSLIRFTRRIELLMIS